MTATVHLVDAAELARGQHRPPVAVCGELVAVSRTVPATDDDPRYCPECVRAAADWNTRP